MVLRENLRTKLPSIMIFLINNKLRISDVRSPLLEKSYAQLENTAILKHQIQIIVLS